ncbi:MAG: GNAT family N-acetyltransferase [Bacteroidia bacterium]|nr:GNAT family N-acetyltransferase [Bacteroidia bacterium]
MGTITSYILDRQEINPQHWDDFICRSPQGSLYVLYDYASLIRADWKAVIVSQNDQWIAVMPFCLNHKWRYRYMPQPMFAQYWGICFSASDPLPPRKDLTRKADIIAEILKHIQPFHLVVQNFSPAFDYPLPFHWAGFELRTRFTYHLDIKEELTSTWQNLSPNIRRNINKAEREGLNLKEQQDGKELEKLFRISRTQGHNIVGNNEENYQKILMICEYLVLSNQGKILTVCTSEGKIIAAAVFAFFGEKTLYLMGVYHPEYAASGAGALLMWEGIKQAKEKNHLIFDFEGSMIEGVEQFFRKFGAIPVPYLQIYKNRLPLIPRWIQELRS